MYGKSLLLVSEPSLGADETAALADVISSNWITMGGRVAGFERAFAEAHGVGDAVAVNSCTAGLHLALSALGIGSGDEVIVPSLSFVATANCVIYTGARAVFADIESLERPLMSLADAEAKLTPRTRAVVVMHYAGSVADAQAWRDFASRNNLFLIEDSAHAVGQDRGPIFGDLAVFSFYGNKNMTTAEGGMILGRDKAVLERTRRARAHGMTSTTSERLNARAASYDVLSLGYNYRMSELNAALGLAQLPKLAARNAKRRLIVQTYAEAFGKRPSGLRLPLLGHAPSAHHLFPVVLPQHADRSTVMSSLYEQGIQTTIHYPPIHQLTWFRQHCPGVSLPVTEAFGARQLTLPLHPKMSEADAEYVAGSLLQLLATLAGSGT
ncbi:DegT/DnrJ/EryC1/StrS family aminotransferase [Rhodopila sp.]|uniref:DegT/DnrJ/EryC1/StrS family aminotransferase n=1 Tax=Rhodopila sp. TaxID=2480087 RepID=UPI003D0E7B6E